ncbi:MAG: response regulator [Desulfobacteraceae bacterium]|nr:response regulator [Desulfobacteraceae bacterium]MDH3838579.1 response regulator [Desulfobacteraceae bacterium]
MPNVTDQQINILIVDDEKAVADVLKDFISDEGRSIDVCHDGLEGIDHIQNNLYDLIIVDLMMPKVGGLDVLKYAKKANPDVLVIIITGYASLETAIMAVKEGAYDYIRKPCKLEEIRIAVNNATDKIKLFRENRGLLKEIKDAYHELMLLKKEKKADKKISSINFFSSNMPSLHYLYNNNCSPNNTVDKLQALSSLKESGSLTESEFKTFKLNLLKMINPEEKQ